MKKQMRDIELITTELQAALKREATDVIAIGDLLIEAKEQLLDHGEWLPWLKENFASSKSTAENYMNAARFATKFPAVGNLKLRPSALYRLGQALNDPTGLYDRKAIKAILKAAETRWINVDEAEAIAKSLQPEPFVEAIEAVKAEMAAAEKAEIDEIFDSPPELPPATENTVHDVILPPFDQAVGVLTHLQTKPLTSFVATTHGLNKIRAVSVFLQEVADAIKQQKAASDQSINQSINQ